MHIENLTQLNADFIENEIEKELKFYFGLEIRADRIIVVKLGTDVAFHILIDEISEEDNELLNAVMVDIVYVDCHSREKLEFVRYNGKYPCCLKFALQDIQAFNDFALLLLSSTQ